MDNKKNISLVALFSVSENTRFNKSLYSGTTVEDYKYRIIGIRNRNNVRHYERIIKKTKTKNSKILSVFSLHYKSHSIV